MKETGAALGGSVEICFSGNRPKPTIATTSRPVHAGSQSTVVFVARGNATHALVVTILHDDAKMAQSNSAASTCGPCRSGGRMIRIALRFHPAIALI